MCEHVRPNLYNQTGELRDLDLGELNHRDAAGKMAWVADHQRTWVESNNQDPLPPRKHGLNDFFEPHQR